MQIGSPEEAIQAAYRIHALGPERVAISLGSQGAVGLDSVGVWYAQPPAIQERNPIGAGDALVAGFVYGLGQDYSIAECLRWGVACGATAASLDGTAMGAREHVAHLAANVQVASAFIGNLKR